MLAQVSAVRDSQVTGTDAGTTGTRGHALTCLDAEEIW